MADIGIALRAKLLTVAAVTDLLGSRIYPDGPPQNPTYPCAIYYVISGVDHGDLQGLIGQAEARVQVDAYAATRTEANTLATAIRDALSSPANSRGTWGSVVVSHCEPDGGGRYSTQRTADGGDLPAAYITQRDYLISFQG